MKKMLEIVGFALLVLVVAPAMWVHSTYQVWYRKWLHRRVLVPEERDNEADARNGNGNQADAESK